MDTYDPTDDTADPFERSKIKNRVKKELGLHNRLGDQFRLAQNSARQRVQDNPELLSQAINEHDPNGKLTDQDIKRLRREAGLQ